MEKAAEKSSDFTTAAQPPNPLNSSIKDNTDNVNGISCQDKYRKDASDGVDKKDGFMYKNKMFSLIAHIPNSNIHHHTKPHMPRAKKKFVRVPFITVIFVSLLICAWIPDAYAKKRLFEADMPVVAIDPGHGGKDTGAKGQNGVLEKTVTIDLARMIAQQLDADYRVVLTRNDDYGLDNSSRTAAANHAKADIFISLHTGSSFIHDINRSTVYFYLPFQGSALTTESKIQQPSAVDQPAVRWNMIQTKYRAASEKLANQMQSRLAAIWQPPDVVVRGIPMLVLEGADMPAVAIEIGNLANASAEKELADPAFLSRIARVIASAIAAFLVEKPK